MRCHPAAFLAWPTPTADTRADSCPWHAVCPSFNSKRTGRFFVLDATSAHDSATTRTRGRNGSRDGSWTLTTTSYGLQAGQTISLTEQSSTFLTESTGILD